LEENWSEENPIENENDALEILKAKWLIKPWQKIVILNHIQQSGARAPYLKVITL
jgi:hypothetical protein